MEPSERNKGKEGIQSRIKRARTTHKKGFLKDFQVIRLIRHIMSAMEIKRSIHKYWAPGRFLSTV
jgi:hypothetical protein